MEDRHNSHTHTQMSIQTVRLESALRNDVEELNFRNNEHTGQEMKLALS